MVACALNLTVESPAWTYKGFFQRTLFNIDVVWSHAHGWPSEMDCRMGIRRVKEAAARLEPVESVISYADPATGGPKTETFLAKPTGVYQEQLAAASAVCSATHIDDFGRFYAHTVELICPSLGFTLFWMLTRRKTWRQLWKPFAIVTVAMMIPAWGLAQPWSEVVRTLIVVLAMMGSAGTSLIAFRPTRDAQPTT
jgi:hypothetical protein